LRYPAAEEHFLFVSPTAEVAAPPKSVAPAGVTIFMVHENQTPFGGPDGSVILNNQDRSHLSLLPDQFWPAGGTDERLSDVVLWGLLKCEPQECIMV
jgi:hypothetical protein